MLIVLDNLRNRLVTFGVILMAATVFSTAPAARSHDDPCHVNFGGPWTQHSLTLNGGDSDGLVVYDATQGVCWSADANLGGDPLLRAWAGVDGINPDGTMDYATARHWVAALNALDGGLGYLGHNDWQLPVTPNDDNSCSSRNNGSFGASCTASALGHLYQVGLGRIYPDSVVAHVIDRIGPFRNLQPALYWSADQNDSGEVTFSFGTGLQFSNTTKYNYFHVLPMIAGAIGPVPHGQGVVRYDSGPAAGLAVYDTNTGITWALDANLAASRNFGITGTTTIVSDVNGSTLTVPLVEDDGTMLFDTASRPGGWLAAMNLHHYAGANGWTIPAAADLETLFQDLNLQQGDVRLESFEHVGPFRGLQPFFYWTCQRDQRGDSRSPCNPALNPPDNPGGKPMRWSFNFDDGFQGTDESTKTFYVIVYYPAPGVPPHQ